MVGRFRVGGLMFGLQVKMVWKYLLRYRHGVVINFIKCFEKREKKFKSSIKIPPKDHLCLGLLPALGPAPVTDTASSILNRDSLKTAPS